MNTITDTTETEKSSLTITTDGKLRPLLTWYDLTPKEQRENENEQGNFFRYLGQVYDLNDMPVIDADTFPKVAKGEYKGHPWQASTHWTAFSGVVIRLDTTGEHVIAGNYMS